MLVALVIALCGALHDVLDISIVICLELSLRVIIAVRVYALLYFTEY
jgi:hypothetical protein